MYGHSIEGIKMMTTTQLNIYMSAINELEREKTLTDLYVQRVSAHSDSKDFKKFEKSLKPVSKKVSTKIPKEWMEE